MGYCLRRALGVLIAAGGISGCGDFQLGRAADQPADTSAAPVADSLAVARARARIAAQRPRGRPAARPGEADFAEVTTALRRLVAAEEAFYGETGVYTSDLQQLQHDSSTGVLVRMVWTTSDGWAARAHDAAAPAQGDCVVFVGQERTSLRTTRFGRRTRAGLIVCDTPETPPTAPPPAPATAARTAPRANRPAPSAAAPTERRRPGADTVNALDVINPVVAMKVDLRNLVKSQNTYFGTQGVYSRRTEPFALQYLWHKGVRLRILEANRDGWAALASHERWPGRTCVIWFGTVDARPTTDRGRAAGAAGEPACDE